MRTTQRELEQELWATTLRLESTGRRLVYEAAAAAGTELLFTSQELQSMRSEEEAWPSPKGLECKFNPVDWSTLWGRFKSPRYFFEGSGREQMKSPAEQLLKEAVNVAASMQEERLLTFYGECTLRELKKAAAYLIERLAEQETAMLDSLKGGDSAEHWSKLRQQLSLLEKSFGDKLEK